MYFSQHCWQAGRLISILKGGTQSQIGHVCCPSSQNQGVSWLTPVPQLSRPIIVLLCSSALWRQVSLQLFLPSQPLIIHCQHVAIFDSMQSGLVFNQKLVRAEASGVIDRYLLVANIQCVLGMSQGIFPSDRQASIVLGTWLSVRQWPEFLL